ncbi:hypothetical protein JCM9279_002956 [Rhodotorula babjevae]
MESTVTLRTSDDPPVEIRVPRTVLAVNSKMFSDMLSIPQSTLDDHHDGVDLAEKHDELVPFLRLLNVSHEVGNPLDDLKPYEWPGVARLADKYDLAAVRGFAMAAYWKWRCEDQEHVAAYRTAVALGDETLATWSLWQLFHVGKGDLIYAALPGRRDDLHAWVSALKFHAFEHSMKTLSKDGWCKPCVERVSQGERYWDAAMRSSMQKWRAISAGKPFSKQIDEQMVRAGLCCACRPKMAERFDSEYREKAPAFPH